MSTFWLVYFISLAVIIIFTALTRLLFTFYGGEEVSISYIIVLDLIGTIPIMGTAAAFFFIILLFIGIIDGDLEPKFEK